MGNSVSMTRAAVGLALLLLAGPAAADDGSVTMARAWSLPLPSEADERAAKICAKHKTCPRIDGAIVFDGAALLTCEYETEWKSACTKIEEHTRQRDLDFVRAVAGVKDAARIEIPVNNIGVIEMECRKGVTVIFNGESYYSNGTKYQFAVTSGIRAHLGPSYFV